MADLASNPLRASRRRRNAIARGLAYAATAFGLGWLVLILGVLLYEGVGGLSLAVFTQDTPPPGSAGGLLNAIAGSLLMTILAPGTTISASIANEFTEAVGDLYTSSLIALGLILFVITFIVLACARYMLLRLQRRMG